MFSGIISIVSVCDEYHREDGIVRNAPCARIAVRERPAAPTRTETALRNGSTNIRRARKILEYMSRRFVYHVQSKHIINCQLFETMLGFDCLIRLTSWLTHHNTFSSSLFVTSDLFVDTFRNRYTNRVICFCRELK